MLRSLGAKDDLAALLVENHLQRQVFRGNLVQRFRKLDFIPIVHR